jgi:polyisoprenoid-binding protein YceI
MKIKIRLPQNDRTLLNLSLIAMSLGSNFSHAGQVPVDQISYKAKTNLSAISVSGKAKNAPSAKVEISGTTAATQTISAFDVELSPNDLDSGLSLRDDHMREKIFKLEDGTLPIIRFKLKEALSLKNEPTPLRATLEIRGKAAEFSPTCSGSLTENGESKKLKFDCKGLVNLENYSIPAPTHLGVKVNPAIEVVISTDQEIKL